MPAGVKVAVDNAAFTFDKLYSYAVPDGLAAFAKIGARALVPFGRGVPRMGVVLALCEAGPQDGLKTVIDLERGEPALSQEMVRLILLLRETTFCTYYDAVKAVLPKNSRLVPDKGFAGLSAASAGHMETVYRYTPGTVPARLTEKQRAVCGFIAVQPRTAAEICAAVGCTRSVIDRLADKGIIERVERTREDETYKRFLGARREIPALSDAQAQALRELIEAFESPCKPDTALLYGVTSSGKTHLYVKLIERAVAAKRGALVLVPEIALATQMIYRLKELFGARVGVIHSALSDSERQIQWESIRAGRYDVIVGTRSAVFAPIKALGLIIIDEEQEQSYISEQNPRYDACAIARFRARETGSKLLLASATPSVESYYRAKSGTYNLVTLRERYGKMPLPTVRVVDMRAELLAGNSHHISLYLKEQVDARIARGEQAILLLNRRGYRTISMCAKCKTIVKCKACDTPLVIHKNRGRYVCHYCQRSYPIEEVCPLCGGKIQHTGVGTQKIEEELEALFPDARVLRVDLDTVQRKNALESHLAAFERGEYDLMIGTQMIAKGLDFRNVTLVGVLGVDQLMLMPSFRANERAFSMLTQVVGRAGRGDRAGEAVIQTVDPENTVLRLAASQDYERFYEAEILMRKAHLYPPFCAMCAVGVTAAKEEDAAGGAAAFADILVRRQQETCPAMPVRVLGPAPMRVAYVNDIFRYRLVIKCRNDRPFRDFLRDCIVIWNKGAYNKKAKLFVDFKNELES